MTQVTVAQVAVKLASSGNRRFVHIFNNGSNPIYIAYDGDDGIVNGTAAKNVTTALGMPIAPGGFFTLNNDGHTNCYDQEVWAISGTGNNDVRVQGA